MPSPGRQANPRKLPRLLRGDGEKLMIRSSVTTHPAMYWAIALTVA
ncbi:MAG: hypothetical protein K0Q92_2109, partial [Steroidobacteraceae bacterium]|nr:hypothetical protein [Steroidobacteraceae bacterium]